MMTSEVVNALWIHLRTALDGARDLSIRPPCARAARRLLAFFSFGTIFLWIFHSHRPHTCLLMFYRAPLKGFGQVW